MIRHLTVAALAASVFVSGCAIHPLPEQVAGVDTPHIVRQIRCETRDAVKATLLDFLRFIGSGLYAGLPEGVRDPNADRLVALYEEQPDLMDKFNSSYFPGPRYVRERAAIDLLLKAGVAYTFDFDIFEDNDIGATVNLLRDINPNFTAGIEGHAKRRRQNERKFTVTDTFGSLLANLNAAEVRGIRYCSGQIVGPNYVYPIAGRVGVDRSVKDFSRMLLFENLGGKDGAAGAAPTMTDDLTFTTTLTLEGTPKLVFAPVGTLLRVANASLDLNVGRSDKHQVTIGLAVDVGGVDAVRGFLFSAGRGSGTVIAERGPTGRQPTRLLWAGQRVTGGGTRSEFLAVIAIDQQKSKEFKLQVAP
ncbi:hypothetical protein V1283_002930 [Bradyrhizobium sp. AZCC 2262]|uniref:hypothetical protein n=1 Tax=Bradyrhizobium sp. AZCC 2262 TaxID=3117022 RepID=UPI002FEF0DE1